MAAGADRIGAMLLHALAERQHLARALVFSERRHVRRRWRWRCGQEVLENPFATTDDRRAISQGCDRQNAALPEQAATILVGNRDAAEMAAVDIRKAIVFGQALIHERV